MWRIDGPYRPLLVLGELAADRLAAGQGLEVHRKRVARLMRVMGRDAVAVYPKLRLSQPGEGHRICSCWLPRGEDRARESGGGRRATSGNRKKILIAVAAQEPRREPAPLIPDLGNDPPTVGSDTSLGIGEVPARRSFSSRTGRNLVDGFTLWSWRKRWAAGAQRSCSSRLLILILLILTFRPRSRDFKKPLTSPEPEPKVKSGQIDAFLGR
jgi:hypothetical protein